MNFNEWWKQSGGLDPADQRKAWNAAMTSCAEMLEKKAEALGKKAEDHADVSERFDARAGQAALLNTAIKIREEIANS